MSDDNEEGYISRAPGPPHSENELIFSMKSELVKLIERIDRIERQVDWIMDNILYHGKTLGSVMEDNPGRWLK